MNSGRSDWHISVFVICSFLGIFLLAVGFYLPTFLARIWIEAYKLNVLDSILWSDLVAERITFLWLLILGFICLLYARYLKRKYKIPTKGLIKFRGKK